MNKLGWYLCGFYAFGIILDIYLSYLDISDSNTRCWILVLAIFGIGTSVLFCKDKQKEKEQWLFLNIVENVVIDLVPYQNIVNYVIRVEKR